MWYMYLLLIFMGLLVGILASTVGIGGGVLFVPILYFIFSLEIHNAVGTSLLAILFLSSSAAYRYYKQRQINYKIAFLLEGPTAFGAYLSSIISRMIPAEVIKILFALALYVASIELIRSTKSKLENNDSNNQITKKRIVLGMLISFTAGLIAGSTGISGGVIKTPTMIIVVGLPTKMAIGTSSLMVFFTALAGVIGHSQVQHVNFLYGFLLGVGAMIGAQIGARLCLKVESRILRVLLGVILLIVATRMLI